MSTRPGTAQFNVVGATRLAQAAGQSFPLGNGNSPAALSTLLITWIASATVGNRIPIVQIKNSAGVVLWQVVGAAITAGQTVILAIGSGVPPSTVASPLMQFLTLPFDFPTPINATIQIFDNANIDSNPVTGDHVAMVADYAM